MTRHCMHMSLISRLVVEVDSGGNSMQQATCKQDIRSGGYCLQEQSVVARGCAIGEGPRAQHKPPMPPQVRSRRTACA